MRILSRQEVVGASVRDLGLDSDALTYLHEGRYKRLTDTGGRVLREILS